MMRSVSGGDQRRECCQRGSWRYTPGQIWYQIWKLTWQIHPRNTLQVTFGIITDCVQNQCPGKGQCEASQFCWPCQQVFYPFFKFYYWFLILFCPQVEQQIKDKAIPYGISTGWKSGLRWKRRPMKGDAPSKVFWCNSISSTLSLLLTHLVGNCFLLLIGNMA